MMREEKTMAEDTVLITRIVNASPALVFDAWINREEWEAWIGPKGRQCDIPLQEPRVGGKLRVTMRLADGSVVPVAGEYKEIEAPRSLIFSWGREGGDPSRHTLITLSLRAQENKTALTFRQEGLGSIASRDAHVVGWNETLDKLDRYLAR